MGETHPFRAQDGFHPSCSLTPAGTPTQSGPAASHASRSAVAAARHGGDAGAEPVATTKAGPENPLYALDQSCGGLK